MSMESRGRGRVAAAALVLSGAALLSFLSRTFLDYRFVYAELGVDGGALGWATVFNLLFYAVWIGALVAASHGVRLAMWMLLGYAILLVAFGIYTVTVLCPTPCRTGWPVGEISIWSNLLMGVLAGAAVALNLRRTRPPAA
ncbi:MAG TPA: hypothetical protein VK849_11820 [Longimicrobiales bacterium]|nr:hypothetical protein [Longimicrobiales bacterium]